MKISSSQALSEDIPPNILRHLVRVVKALNGAIEFGDPVTGPVNIKGKPVQVTTPVGPDTEFAVTHNLGYVPTQWLVTYQDKAGSIYASGGTAWDTQKVYLKCNQASVKVILFVF